MEFHQLVRTWLVCASCQLPVISKSFELQIQVGGGKGSNKVKILRFVFFFLKILTSRTHWSYNSRRSFTSIVSNYFSANLRCERVIWDVAHPKGFRLFLPNQMDAPSFSVLCRQPLAMGDEINDVSSSRQNCRYTLIVVSFRLMYWFVLVVT